MANQYGVSGLTKTALDSPKTGWRIKTICPATGRTRIVEECTGGDAEREAEIAGYYPIRRIANPREIAEAVLWRCSDAASFVLGHALVVDGGCTTR